MIKRYLFFNLLFGLVAFLQKADAQLIFYSDSGGSLFTVDISSGGCDVTLLGQMEYNGNLFIATDLAFHPNGRLYATDGFGFYEIDLSDLTVSFIGNFDTGDFINALVSNNEGVVYGAANRLITIDENTGTGTVLGNLPCSSAGDLAFNNNELYLACASNALLRINLNNTAASQIVGTMQADELFFGIVTFATECSDVQTFGTAGNDLYQIDVSNANSTFVCMLDGTSEVFGAAMETDFLASDCFLEIDLDGDNSTAPDFDFEAEPICGNNSSMIADFDYSLIIDAEIDSMHIWISGGLLDGANEQLILNDGETDNFDIIGSGTNQIRLISTGGTTIVDVAHVLENARYINVAMPYTPGIREISVQIFGEEDTDSNVAMAFIPLVAPEEFEIDIGPDSTLCEGETLLLDATYPGATNYLWNDSSMEAVLDVTTSGVYAVTVTDECGTTATDQATITFIPPIDILDLGPDTILCPGETLLLDATLIDGESYEWNDGSTEPTLLVSESGIYEVSVTAGCGIQTGEIFVEYEIIPEISVLPDDTLACQGTIVLFDATLPGALTYTWQDGSTEPVFAAAETGNYAVTVTFQCGTYVDETSLIYNDYELRVDLGNDTTFCFGDTVLLDAYFPFATEYLWQDGSTDSVFVVRETGDYGVTISDGCTSVNDRVFYRMISCCDVFVPNIFTPNSDGLNDRFMTYSNCEFPRYRFSVFNRWGALVFRTEDQRTGWDGYFKGESAQEGVYVWMLEYNDGIDDRVLSGDVTLIR